MMASAPKYQYLKEDSWDCVNNRNREDSMCQFVKRLITRWAKRKTCLLTKKPKVIFYDFDGVMTDNRILQFEDGREAVWVNRSDGLAVSTITKLGVEQIIISAEVNMVVKARAEKLKIKCIHGVKDKMKTVQTYMKENNIKKEEAVFVGNDINDREAMEYVGYSISPLDAHDEIKKISKLILNARGGYGVVREILDLLVLQERESE